MKTIANHFHSFCGCELALCEDMLVGPGGDCSLHVWRILEALAAPEAH